jgi:hypothetical protein
MIPIQILGVLFGLAMLYVTYDYYKRKGLDLKDIAGWVVLWCVFILVILFPTALLFVSQKLNLTRAIDSIMIVSFVVMIYLVFNLYNRIKKIERNMEKMVEAIALRDAKDEENIYLEQGK